MHLVQLRHEGGERRVALVDAEQLHLLTRQYPTTYHLASTVVDSKKLLSQTVEGALSSMVLDYDAIYRQRSQWQILPAIDHPNQSECLVTGTGLTHKASAANRQKMHLAADDQDLTDSMQMYLWGEERGKPPAGKIGVQPEWFYKGNGSVLRAHD
ncbi:MAG: GguC protein, partial [Saprospiraceae bacterium]|nr:GguC protein [Saprospiraceae bacterium]